jgi:transposase-like protein
MKKRESNSSVRQAKPARRKYDEEFKQQALMMPLDGQSARSVAEALGISENLLRQWKRAARASQSTAELEVGRLRLRLKQPEDFERAYYQRTEARENFGHRPGKDTIANQHSCPLK